MATILDRADICPVACIHSERKFGNGRHNMGGAVVGTSGSATVVDYIRLGDSWRFSDFTDSVRDAQALLEIRLCIGGSTRIE